MRLSAGQRAPRFSVEAMSGAVLSTDTLRGRTVLLKFFRFAACPICNLHLREYVRRADELAAAGVTSVVVFHSPTARIRRRVGDGPVPFEIVADPGKRLFEVFGVESSVRGMFARRVARDYARAMRAGYRSAPFGHEGGITGHPADFLIDPDGIVRHAHYGRDYADSLGVDDVLALLGAPAGAGATAVPYPPR